MPREYFPRLAQAQLAPLRFQARHLNSGCSSYSTRVSGPIPRVIVFGTDARLMPHTRLSRARNFTGLLCFQCIIKGRPASEGGSSLWRRHRSVSLHCNRKTERSGCLMERVLGPVSSGGGFAPEPPGFSALVPVPMRGLYPQVIKKGMQGIPPRSVEATESALGLLPSRALSSAQFVLIITADRRRTRTLWWDLEYGTLPWGKDPRWHESLPPKEATRNE